MNLKQNQINNHFIILANFTDSWDQRIFDAYCTNIFRRELIELSQCALVPDDDTPYQIPRNVNFMSYLNFIVSQFPQEDGNKVFGQNENANIIYLESCSAYALQKLRLVQLQGKISSHGQQFDVTNLDKVCFFCIFERNVHFHGTLMNLVTNIIQ